MNEQSERLNAAIADFLEQVEAGLQPDLQSFLDGHADIRPDLESFFADYGQMQATIAGGEQISHALGRHFEGSPVRSLVEASLGASESQQANESPIQQQATPQKQPQKTTVPTVADITRADLATTSLPRDFGDYILLELIAFGGMGVVYKARQRSLDRVVALKMILAGQLAGDEEVQRFFREAQAAGGLDHPAIVPVYEVGTNDGQHFFSMGIVEGGSLADEIREGPLAERTAAEYVQTIAEAVDYAHQRGVVHRDIKPGNILIDGEGNLKITDFGLATRSEDADGVTATGQILGTPAYMPPEQATGIAEKVGPLSDVYAIGAVLYCLLAGRPPFQAPNPIETLRQVINQEPVSPRQLAPGVSRDLETICLKCLEKEPSRRYGSARELADDLIRFRKRQPILARPIGQVAKTAKLIRRHQIVSILIGIVAASLLLGTGVSIWFAVEATARANAELKAKRDLQVKEREATQLADEKSELVVQKSETIRRLEDYLYVSRLREAQAALVAGDFGACRRLLNISIPKDGELDRRCFVWRHLQYRLRQADPFVHDIRGDYLMMKHGCAAVAADGTQFAVAFRKHVWLGDPSTNKIHRTIASNEIADVSFTQDNHYLAVAFGRGIGSSRRKIAALNHLGVTLYNLRSPKEPELRILVEPSHRDGKDKSPVGVCVACSPTEPILACGQTGGKITLWNYELGQRVAELIPPDHSESDVVDFEKLLFTPDGTQLISARFGHAIDLWDVATAKHQTELYKYPFRIPFRSRFYRNAFWLVNPVALAISRDGKTVAAAANGLHIEVIDLVSGHVELCVGHSDAVSCLAFLPDDKTLASTSLDHGIRLWNAKKGIELAQIGSHRSSVHGLIVNPSGREILTAGSDNRIRRWKLPAPDDPPDTLFVGNHVYDLAFVPNSDRLFSGGWPTRSGAVKEWDTATGRKITMNPAVMGRAYSIDVSADGTNRFSSDLEGRGIDIWDENGVRIQRIDTKVTRISAHPSGEFVSTGRSILNRRTGKHIKDLAGTPRFSPDGNRLVTALDGQMKFWNALTLEPLELKGPANASKPRFSPDGRLLAITKTITSFAVWDIEGERMRFEADGHFSQLSNYAFAPDGKTVASVGHDRRILLWDLKTGRMKGELTGHTAELRAVAFNTAGTTLATAGVDGMIRLWRATSVE